MPTIKHIKIIISHLYCFILIKEFTMPYYSNTPNISVSQNLADKITDGFIDFYKEQHFYNYHITYDNFIEDLTSRFSNSGFKVTWDMGGTWGDYNGKIGVVSGSTEPEMVELDNFLIKNYPTIGILQYRMIINSVDKSTKKEGDFYGGSTTTGIKFLSFDSLNNVLLQYDLEQPSVSLNKNTLIEFFKEKYSSEWFAKAFPSSNEVQALQNSHLNNDKSLDSFLAQKSLDYINQVVKTKKTVPKKIKKT